MLINRTGPVYKTEGWEDWSFKSDTKSDEVSQIIGKNWLNLFSKFF